VDIVMLAVIGIGVALLGAGSWIVISTIRRQRDLPEGQAFRAAWARLDRSERREVKRLVDKGQASDDPQLAAAAVAMVRLVRATDPRASRGQDPVRVRLLLVLLLVLFLFAVAIPVAGAVAGLDPPWLLWVAGINLVNLIVVGVIVPRRQRQRPERLAAAERGNLETVGRAAPWRDDDPAGRRRAGHPAPSDGAEGRDHPSPS
jgi:hypothetical protein